MKTAQSIILSVIIATLLIACGLFLASGEPVEIQTASHYNRIISLAPNVTEILYALGLGDKIVGVTRYCKYPPQAMTKKKIGGYLDQNYEAIITTEPDLVIVFDEQVKPVNHFERLGIKTLTVKHMTIEDILESIMKIGTACNVRQKAEQMVREIKTKIEIIKERTKNLDKPKVLLCVERNIISGSFEAVYIAGDDGFYNKMIDLAGGVNAYKGRIKFPKVGYEGIIAMNPDVIIDIARDSRDRGLDKEELLRQWDAFSDVGAVRKKRVYIFSENYIAIPGPRFILTLERIAKAIHPKMEQETID
ncbi:MAG: ABC transporter substrate-binding protein [Planctomycetes bacterium]|nr:ABC transporter substrate-binding protein [Planctomycetota bacterium]